MTEDGGNETSTVVEFRPQKALRASEQKWGERVIGAGFCIVPSLLIRAQQRLGLNPTQFAILIHLADFWWDASRKPFPSKKTLSERLGIGPRQVQRYLADLEDAGLVKRIERTAAHRGKISNEFDLTGLVLRLRELEPEFREVEDKARASRRAVTLPKGKRSPEDEEALSMS